MPQILRRGLLLALTGFVLWFAVVPAVHLGLFLRRDQPVEQVFEADHADDVSRLERTAVRETLRVPSDPAEAERQLAGLLRRASEEGVRVSIAGARHSMGGHTISPGGFVIDMRGFDGVRYDQERDVVVCGAGAMWSKVLRVLDPHGRSVAVMQSNESFTVGGSLSVNCHGWQHGRPPVSSSVQSLRVMTAGGEILRCTRDENAELFSLVLGGYGLFGIILEAELDVVPNEVYASSVELLGAAELGEEFLARAAEPANGMVIGRMSVAPGDFLERGLLKVLRRVEVEGDLPPLSPSGKRGFRRAVFRASAGSGYGKELRWTLERRVAPLLMGGEATRNSELAEPAQWFASHDPGGTDLLHESFVPHGRLGDYLERAREILPELVDPDVCDLLNVTVRDVRRDPDTVLAYAREDMFSLVMLFHQQRTPEGERCMEAIDRALVDLALELGGTYYLPYRLHATRAQFDAAYPRAGEVREAKGRLDPGGVFGNRFFDAYLAGD